MKPPTILFLTFILLGALSCEKPEPAKPEASPAVPVGAQVATISIPTAKCENCEKTIREAVAKVDGVTECDVNAKSHTAKVQFIAAKTGLSQIEQTIAKAGYTADAVQRDSAGYANLEDCCK